MGDIDRWAHIDEDLFKEISKRFFSYDDYIQLRLVCKEWSLKLPKIPNGNKLPWLLLPEETIKNHSEQEEEICHLMQLPVVDEEILDTHALEKEGIYHVILPDMQMQNKIIRGSSHGWLIILDISKGTMHMLNPFTKVEMDLPPLSTFPNVIDDLGDEYIMCYFGETSYTLDRIFMHKHQVWKVVINSSPDSNNENFIAVAIYGCGCRLAFYKPNYRKWVEFPTRDTMFEDVIFFEDKIFAVNHDGQLYEFDTKSSGLEGGIHEVEPPSKVAKGSFKLKYLIGCANGSLLMLVRHYQYHWDRPHKECDTCKFDIYELKKYRKEWSKLDNLDNYVLMIGLGSSVQITSSSLGKGSQIYFTDNYIEIKSADYAVAQDIGIFSLEEGSFQRIMVDVKYVCPPVWVLP